MIVSTFALLLLAPLPAASPVMTESASSPSVHLQPAIFTGRRPGWRSKREAVPVRGAEEQAQAAQTAGLSVQRICRGSAPSMFSGRAKRENCEMVVVQPRCKSSAPTMFSGRARTQNCVVEMQRPHVATYAPSIFSGRAPKPASAYAPPPASSAYAPPASSYAVAADGVATPQVTYRTRVEAPKVQPRRRLPTMFTGRRPRAPATPPSQ